MKKSVTLKVLQKFMGFMSSVRKFGTNIFKPARTGTDTAIAQVIARSPRCNSIMGKAGAFKFQTPARCMIPCLEVLEAEADPTSPDPHIEAALSKDQNATLKTEFGGVLPDTFLESGEEGATSQATQRGLLAKAFVSQLEAEAEASGNAMSAELSYKVWMLAAFLFSAVIFVVLAIVLIKIIITLVVVFAVCVGVAAVYMKLKGGRRRLLSAPAAPPLQLDHLVGKATTNMWLS